MEGTQGQYTENDHAQQTFVPDASQRGQIRGGKGKLHRCIVNGTWRGTSEPRCKRDPAEEAKMYSCRMSGREFDAWSQCSWTPPEGDEDEEHQLDHQHGDVTNVGSDMHDVDSAFESYG